MTRVKMRWNTISFQSTMSTFIDEHSIRCGNEDCFNFCIQFNIFLFQGETKLNWSPWLQPTKILIEGYLRYKDKRNYG